MRLGAADAALCFSLLLTEECSSENQNASNDLKHSGRLREDEDGNYHGCQRIDVAENRDFRALEMDKG